MIENLGITAVVENTSGTPSVAGEWGLAFWIEADEHRILFDTGQGRSLLQNANTLGIELATAQSLVISHGHYDHIGGIPAAVAAGFRGTIYVHPAALNAKFQRESAAMPRQIGAPPAVHQVFESKLTAVIETSKPTEIVSGILVSGTVPRSSGHENVPGGFFLDEACSQPDLLMDDQAMLIETRHGWLLITGCGHAGLINLLRYSRELTGGGRIFAVIGGLHLLRAPTTRLQETIACLRDCEVGLIAPCHCTGFEAIVSLRKAFGNVVVPFHAATRIQISAAGARSTVLPKEARTDD